MRFVTLAIVLVACSASLSAQGITQQQADAILQELKAMRAAIERLASAGPARPNATGPAANEPVTLPSVGTYVMGSASAPITIVEFTDLQCPFCSRFASTTFDELKRTYIDTGKVRFATRDLPLPMHPYAVQAAKASRCAGEQNKFWELRMALVRNASTLSPALITEQAKLLKLNMAAFDRCLASNAFDSLIEQDVATAKSIGVTGTPTFVVGKTTSGPFTGSKLIGAPPLSVFEARLKPLLTAAGY